MEMFLDVFLLAFLDDCDIDQQEPKKKDGV